LVWRTTDEVENVETLPFSGFSLAYQLLQKGQEIEIESFISENLSDKADMHKLIEVNEGT
jgi:hypothetical protein